MATPVLCCGFECGGTGSGGHIWVFTNSSISTSAPITGDRSLLCAPSAATSFANYNNTLIVGGVWVIRFKVRFATLPSANTAICRVNQNLVGAYFKQSESKIYAGLSATDAGASGVSVTTDVDYYIDISVVTTANPWLTNVSVNGVACGQHSNAVAASTTARSIDLGFTSAVTASAKFDDYIISLTADDFPFGDGYVNHFVPTADGTHNVAGAADFQRTLTGTDITNATTTAFQLVDDVPLDSGTPTDFINLIAPPNATDYVEVIFGPAPGVSTPTVAPRAVDVITVSAAFSTTGNNLRLALNDNGTLDDIRNATVGSTTCIYNRKHYATGPAGAWVIGGGGNGDFTDLRMRCFTSDPTPDPYFVGAMIEAEFAAAAGSTPLTQACSDDLNAAF